MVLHDDRTGRGYPLPHPDHLLEDDVQRLRDAIDGLDRDATALEERAEAADAALAGLEAGKAGADLSNVPAAAFQAKAAAVGLALPAVTAGDAGKSLIVNPEGTGYAVGAPASTIQQTGPLYAPGGAGFSLTGKSVLAAYEQVAGQTFGLDYNTRASYAEQDGVNGTDAAGGAFALHNTAGAVIDANTKLLIHADGVNGSTEIIDERGITPFGTHCAYFDGTAYWTVPASYKLAFGTSQNFTIECWVRPEGIPTNAPRIFSLAAAATGFETLMGGYDATTSKFYMYDGTLRNPSTTSVQGAWYHFAVVRSGSTLSWYINGVLFYSGSTSMSLGPLMLFLGAANDGSAKFFGWLDQFRVSKVARYTGAFTPPTTEFVTDADTVHLFQFNDGHGSQFIRDSSKSGLELYLGGGTEISTAQSKFGGSSLVSAGGGLTVSTSKPNSNLFISSLDFTLDFWVRLSSVSTTQHLFHLGGSSFSPLVWMNSSDGQLRLQLSSNGSSWDVATDITFGVINPNVWTHVAVVRSGASVYAFINGVLGATVTIGTSSLHQGGGASYYIGRQYSGIQGTSGYIDEFRVKLGQAVWTANFTPPTVPYTTDDRTVLLLHFEGANGDKVALDSSESSYGTNGFGDSPTPALSFVGSAALDATYTRGGHGTSLRLNGSGYASIQYVTPSAGHPIYFVPSDKLCIEGWFYCNTGGTVFSFSGASLVSATGTMGINVGGPSTTVYFNDSPFVTGPGTVIGWNHFALVKDGRGWIIYINGVGGTGGIPQGNFSYQNEGLILGLGYQVRPGSNYLNGAIDSFRITHGKPRYTDNFTPGNLTQDEDTALLWVFDGSVGQKWVKELSKNTALIPSTNARTVKDGRYITTNGTGISISTSVSKFGTGSVSQNGSTNSYLSLLNNPDLLPPGDFTFDSWIRVSGQGTYFEKRTAANSQTCSIFINSTRNVVCSYVDTAGTTIHLTSVNQLQTPFTHIALVRNSGSLKLYIAGSLDSSVTATNGIRQDTDGTLYIGCRYDNAVPFNGQFDEFRISNVARWTANFTPPTIPYGQQYVTGPFWVATKPGVSALDLSAFSSVAGVAFSGATPPGTTITYLLSTDGYDTPLRRWTGSAWAATAHSMSWNATTKALATSATAAQLNAAGNSFAELQAGLRALDVSAVASLNVVAVLASNNPQFSPSLDAITLNMDEYQIMQPGADYTVRRKKANGVQTLEFKRLKPGNANHVVDYVG